MLDILDEESALALLKILPELPENEKEQLLADLELLEQKRAIQAARDNFLTFCKQVYPDFKEGPHHRFMAPILTKVRDGEETRVTVSMPPRFSKSETVSYLFVAWYLGHRPKDPIIMCTHTADLSAAFGRKIRNLIESDTYKAIFPDTVVSRDKSAADNWTTTLGGKYLAVGVGANIAGHGGALVVIDDAVSEQSVLNGDPDKAFATAFEWLQVGPLQRLAPGGRVLFVGTRWGKKDPIGRALSWAEQNPEAPQWTEIRFPAILPSGKSLWPEQWPVEQLIQKKASLAPAHWNAQYMQSPTTEEGALIKREWWKTWEKDDPPDVEFVMQVWDTAHETKNHNDYSACITWGVWFNEETNRQELIMLDAIKGRWEFPQLKQRALDYYREWKPECVLIEKKAAGAPLIQELRQMGMFIEEFSPSRGARGMSNDKRSRVNAIAPLFYDGAIWAPGHRWASEVIEECASFPNGEHDDYVDCLVAGTQVAMADGTLKPVELLRVGDMVSTPMGAKEVTQAWCSGVFKTIIVEVAGTTLQGTPNHPVATSRGWVALADLQVSDTIKMASTKGAWQWPLRILKKWYSMVRPIGGTPMQKKQRTEGTSCVPEDGTCCTGTFGSSIRGLFQKDGMCTTKMETQATTLLRTWKPFRQKCIMRSTLRNEANEVGPQSSGRTLRLSETLHLLGTVLQKGLHGIRPLPQRTWLKMALRTAHSHKHALNGKKTRTSSFARSVARLLKRFWLRARCVAMRARVVGITEGNAQRVYNLTVADARCFYANGLLVHNCVSMATARYRNGGFISLSNDEQDTLSELTRRRKTTVYY